MHLVLRRSLLALAMTSVGWPAAVAAAPHTRSGLCMGVGFGLESVSWTDQDGGRRSEGSGSGNARVGYALKPDLVVGVEFWAWAKSYEFLAGGLPVPVDLKLTATTLCASYFPGGGGFFVRLGAGIAYGRVSVEPPANVAGVPAGADSETGFALTLAPGYEWRLSDRFALGAQGDVVYLGLQDSLKHAFGYGINAQFNWYW